MATTTPQEAHFELTHWNDDRGPSVIITTTVFVAFAMTTVVLRLITRKAITKISWQVDDYAIILAMILALGLYTEALLSVHYGTGTHSRRVGVESKVKILAVSFALEVTYLFCLLAIKISLLFLYRAVLTLKNPRLKFAWYVVGASILAFTVGSILAASLQCKPIHYLWDRLHDHIQGHCLDPVHRVLLLFIPSGLNTLANVALLILPIPTLWSLQMPLRPKLGLMVVLLLGTFACVASAIRMSYLTAIEDQADFTYTGALPVIWSIVEPCMGISCACLSTLRPFYRVLHDSIQRLRVSGSKLLTTQRPIFHSAMQKVSITSIGNFTKQWVSRSQKDPSEADETAVAVKGSSRIEMRNMGYNSLDAD